MMNYLEVVREFVIENFLFGDAGMLEEEMSFLENGIIDSTGILELIEFLEAEFDIIISDDELIPENLDSLKNVNGFLHKKLNGQSSV